MAVVYYEPTGGVPTNGAAISTQYTIHVLIEAPERETRQDVSEVTIPSSTNVVVDVIGKPTTKLRYKVRVDTFANLVLLEGCVGTDGILQYAEYPSGQHALFVSLTRYQYVPNADVHLCNAEFWVLV